VNRLMKRFGVGGWLPLMMMACVIGWVWGKFANADEAKPFVISVIDAQTKRGVPLVELSTTHQVKFVTDSAGIVAITDPDLLNQKVFFSVFSHGYEFAKDGFGMAGRAMEVTPGGKATLELKRINIAERLYRTTGGGIYRDSVMAGLPVPIAEPLINAQVMGQDSIQRVLYKGKIYWFWGDTNQLRYPLGHFGMSGAVSDLPGNGGLDPSTGINYTYFKDSKTGFARPMVPGNNLRWIDGLIVLKEPGTGKEQLIAKCEVLKSLTEPLGRKLIIYNDEKEVFEDLAPLARDEQLCPNNHPIRHTVEGVEYLYFPSPFPLLRVKAELESIKTPAAYEGYTCMAAGERYAKGETKIDRDGAGKVVWAWKKNTPPLMVAQQNELIKLKKLSASEMINPFVDVDTNSRAYAHSGSVNWNEYLKKWIMITGVLAHDSKSPSMLGEIYYAESDSPNPEGPWTKAKKILTHDRYSFYNPNHHPFFDQQGGKVIYFEGTYTYTFSRQEKEGQTARYDYNNVMYRLDLGDGRLKF